MTHDRRSDRDWWERISSSDATFWTATNTIGNQNATTACTIENMLATVAEFERRFPADTIVRRVDVDPATYRVLSKVAAKCGNLSDNLLHGIETHTRPDLPSGCLVRWYVDGHFEVSPGFCEVHG